MTCHECLGRGWTMAPPGITDDARMFTDGNTVQALYTMDCTRCGGSGKEPA